MRYTDDGPNKRPNHIATLRKSDSCIGRKICLFTDTILMFISTDKIVFGIHTESNVANTDKDCLLRT
jgi:hypothetical protein